MARLLLWAFWALPLVSAAPALPHGLLPPDEHHPAHARLLRHLEAADDDRLIDACSQRLAALKGLIAEEKIAAAMDLSRSLTAHTRRRLPAACETETAAAGLADVFTKVASPADRTDPSATANTTRRISIDGGDPLRLAPGLRRLHPAAKRTPVAGFALDGAFYAAESPIACEARDGAFACAGPNGGEHRFDSAAHVAAVARHLRARKLPTSPGPSERFFAVGDMKPLMVDELAQPWVAAEDIVTAYATGALNVLVMVICFSGEAGSCEDQYDFGLVATDHGSDVFDWWTSVMDASDAFLQAASYGRAWLDWSFHGGDAPLFVELDVTVAECASLTNLGYYTQDPDAYDTRAYAATGVTPDDYDFVALVIPWCGDVGWAGAGWVGYPGLICNAYAANYDNAFVHELGHNFGASHASYMTGGERGAVAYQDDEGSWVEYGSPFTTMGQAWFEVDLGLAGQFMAANKLVFDWVDEAKAATVDVYDFAGGDTVCADSCGPYALDLYDDVSGGDPNDMSADAEGYLALRIPAQAADTYFFLERRQYPTPGVLLSWASVDETYGYTGYVSNTVLVDCTPTTVDGWDLGFDDAQLVDSCYVDLSSTPGESYPVRVDFDGASVTLTATGGNAVVTWAPSSVEEGCTEAGSCCAEIAGLSNTYTWADFGEEPWTRVAGSCCEGYCSYVTQSGNYYLAYASARDAYYVTDYDICMTVGSFAYYDSFPVDDIVASCSAGDPVPAPTTWDPPVPSPTMAMPTDDPWTDDGYDDDACGDSSSWFYGSGKGCAKLFEDPSRCKKKSHDKVMGYEACPYACGLCDATSDSESWYANGKPKNSCDWIARSPSARCGKKDDAGVRASYACPEACGDDDDDHTAESCLADFGDELEAAVC